MHDTKPDDDGRTADENSDLSANRFDLDLDEDLLEAATADDKEIQELVEAADTGTKAERLAEHYSEQVARQWGTPEGAWWP